MFITIQCIFRVRSRTKQPDMITAVEVILNWALHKNLGYRAHSWYKFTVFISHASEIIRFCDMRSGMRCFFYLISTHTRSLSVSSNFKNNCFFCSNSFLFMCMLVRLLLSTPFLGRYDCVFVFFSLHFISLLSVSFSSFHFE